MAARESEEDLAQIVADLQKRMEQTEVCLHIIFHESTLGNYIHYFSVNEYLLLIISPCCYIAACYSCERHHRSNNRY